MVLDAVAAWRHLRQRLLLNGFVAVVIGFGLGVAVVALAIAYALFLRPLPFRSPEQLYFLYAHNLVEGLPFDRTSFATYIDWKDQTTAWQGIEAFTVARMNLVDGSGPQPVHGAQVTSGFFHLLGVVPDSGRLFREDEDRPEAARVVILSARLWSSRYGAEPAALGRRITIENFSGGSSGEFEIVGIMPPGVHLPENVDLWIPLVLPEPARRTRAGRWLAAIGRLRNGSTIAEATAELDVVSSSIAAAFPRQVPRHRVNAVPLRDYELRDIRLPIRVFGAAAISLFVITITNFVLLMLGQLVAGQMALAVRRSLGASRAAITRAAVAPQILVIGAGAAVAASVALVGGSWLVRALADQFPAVALPDLRTGDIAVATAILSLLVLAVGIALTTLVAHRLSAEPVNGGLPRRPARRRIRAVIVIAQVAFALVLTIAALLMSRTITNLNQVDLGFDPDRLLTARLELPLSRYPDDHDILGFFARLEERVGSLPGVKGSALTSSIGVLGDGDAIEGLTFVLKERDLRPEEKIPVPIAAVSPAYFELMGTSPVEGRTFDRTDTRTSAFVAVVNETMARRFWNGQPMGQHLRFGGKNPPWRRIVGVVRDVRLHGPKSAPAAMLYLPREQFADTSATLLIRAGDNLDHVATNLRAAVRELDPQLPLLRLASMRDALGSQLATPRMILLVVGFFAVVAVLLTTFGLFVGVVYDTTRQVREIGLRLALGADRSRVVHTYLRQNAILIGLGLAIGALGATVATGFLSALLFGVRPTDPVAFVAAALFLLATSLLATWLPAFKASRLSPSDALRES